MTSDTAPTILIVGASRGLGRAMAAEFLGHGWDVLGTVRDPATRTELHALADEHPGRVGIEVLDITDEAGTAGAARPARRPGARRRVRERRDHERPADPDRRVTTEDFVDVMVKRDRAGLEYLDYLGRTVPW